MEVCLDEALATGTCLVEDDMGGAVPGEVRGFGDERSCTGVRIHGLGLPGTFHVTCAAGSSEDSAVEDSCSFDVEFYVGTEPCPEGSLEGASFELSGNGIELGAVHLPALDDAFFAEGGLVRVTDTPTALFGYLPLYFVKDRCEKIGPTLSLQLLQPDGSESEVVEVDLPCDEVETGCAASRRPRAAWLAILGLPLLLARRRRG